MKTIFASIALFVLACSTATAQNNLKLVPTTASFIARYSGENFTKNISIKKIDSYSFIKDDFFKILNLEKQSSLQKTGINFDKDMYQYAFVQDTCVNFVSILEIKNETQFVTLLKNNYQKAEPVTKSSYKFLAVSNHTYIGWNGHTAIIVNSNYQSTKNFYDDYYTPDTTQVPSVYVDSVTTTEPDTTITEEERIKKQIKEEEEQRIRDSIYNYKWDLWQQQQEMIAKKQQQAAAEKIIINSFAANITNIENNVGYTKIIDPAAHISVWLNTENIFNQYMNYFNRGGFGMISNLTNQENTSGEGYNTAFNLYFENDRLRIDQKTFSTDPEMNKLGLSVMNNKQSNDLIDLVNPDNIGYLSMSINTEAMANYYYSFLKKYLTNSFYMKDYADMIDVYIDLVQIIVDEKGIAELLPGNYMFVVHDMKPQMVDYTDYDYDSNYNQIEVRKTKKELSPDFTLAFETKKESFVEKVMHLPLKYAEKEKFNYKQKDGYYVLTFDTGKYPISSLYFMHKDGKVIITTSAKIVDMVKAHTGYSIDAETKNSILNNNYSLQLNSKKLIEKLQTQFSTDVNKQISSYLMENLGNVKMESSIKDGMIQGTTTMNIKGKHKNSLEFLFNMIESINNIIEKDRQEKEKKIY